MNHVVVRGGGVLEGKRSWVGNILSLIPCHNIRLSDLVCSCKESKDGEDNWSEDRFDVEPTTFWM